jgi:hypothetical protein
LFPALEAGQVTFAQADEIRRAPAHLRQTLVDRAIHDGLPSTEIRVLVGAARATERRARSIQREQLTVTGPTTGGQLEVALEILLSHRIASANDRKLLLQMREVVDRLLASAARAGRPDRDTQNANQSPPTSERSVRARSRSTRSNKRPSLRSSSVRS